MLTAKALIERVSTKYQLHCLVRGLSCLCFQQRCAGELSHREITGLDQAASFLPCPAPGGQPPQETVAGLLSTRDCLPEYIVKERLMVELHHAQGKFQAQTGQLWEELCCKLSWPLKGP